MALINVLYSSYIKPLINREDILMSMLCNFLKKNANVINLIS